MYGQGRARTKHYYHYRLYLCPQCPVCLPYHHHDLIPWHPHTAKESSLNDPAMQHRLAFSGLNLPVPEPICPSSLYATSLPNMSSFCSHRPGIFLQVIPHHRPPSRLVNIKLRKPSHGQPLQQNSAARLLTRWLAGHLTCSGEATYLLLFLSPWLWLTPSFPLCLPFHLAFLKHRWQHFHMLRAWCRVLLIS